MYLLALDIGNTNIVVGIMESTTVVHSARIGTDRHKTNFDFLLQLRQLLEVFGVDVSMITDGILSSVVPELTLQVAWAMEQLLGKTILTLGNPQVRTGLITDIDTPTSLGADRVADAVGAINEYPTPLIIIDMGTATTVSVIDRRGHHIGGLIIPGARTSLNSLSAAASQLPFIPIEAPTRLIGRNTIDCMKSGIVYGYASMIDGLIERIESEMGEPMTVVATGGLSRLIAPYCRHEIRFEPDLLLKGLYYIYAMQKK